MKKITLILLAAFSAFVGLGAWEMPPRYFEIGFDTEFGVANSYLSWGDVFNSRKTLEIDFDKLGDGDFSLEFMEKGNFFINVQTRGKYKIGVGFFSGFDGSQFVSLSEETMEFIFKGNGGMSSLDGEMSLGGSVFMDAGLKGYAQIGKWHFTAAPALYAPLIYVTAPEIDYHLTTSDPVYGFLEVNSEVYTAFPIDDGFSAKGIFGGPKGFDLSVDVSYNLFPFLDVGGAVGHIPIYPAFLADGALVDKIYEINGDGLSIEDLLEDGFDGILYPEPSKDDYESFSGERKAVFRPLRFSGYAFLKPFKKDWLAFKPWMGLSFLTVYDKACFNFGLDTQLKLINMFNLYYSFSYMEKVWQNKMVFGLNFRVLELDVGAGFRSRDFAGAWTVKGFYGSVGLRLGF
jgi:hypothetical protein